jgi:hypothetical protein
MRRHECRLVEKLFYILVSVSKLSSNDPVIRSASATDGLGSLCLSVDEGLVVRIMVVMFLQLMTLAEITLVWKYFHKLSLLIKETAIKFALLLQA